MRKTVLMLLIGSLFFSNVATGNTNLSSELEQAYECRNILSKLERLQCFDRAFELDNMDELRKINSIQYPPTWLRAVNSEKERGIQTGFIFNQKENSNKSPRIWLSAAAINSSQSAHIKQEPILMLTCYEEITRVELILPEPIESGKVTVTIPGRSMVTQDWISDESGYLLRSGRGIPAIEAIKAMISAPHFILRSNTKSINNLKFDNSNLAEALKPIRERCQW
ncbi:type VI secretion system-associated protein VasI [Photobacterium leiognathi]|uniref:type VI secretion system-associated protein VasI n=1 Tax=Photobacterium leiognathi TaxID=553611 RepID=UPI002981122F|nr:type VI secretion system-associated protein VasI [Photobacterium leiognathi]